MKRKIRQITHLENNKNYFEKRNFICNVILVIIAIISCATYITGNLISLYNYYETKNQNDISNSSDLTIPSIIYNGTIDNKKSIFDSIFKDSNDKDTGITKAPGFTVNKLTIYNNGSYNASDVQIQIYINIKAIDYLIQFIKDNNLDLEISYKENSNSNCDTNKEYYNIYIHQKSKSSYYSRLITTFAGHIQNIKKDSQATIEFPDNLIFLIRLFAYLKANHGDRFDIKDLQNPIVIKIRSFGRGNTAIYKTIEARMSDIILLEQSSKIISYFTAILIDH